jgi:isoleucyl-tRNA synthetase
MPYASLNMVGIVELLKNSANGIELDENNLPFIHTRDGNKHKILPADFIAEGIDQTRGWFYTLFVLSTSLFDTIPFKNVIVNGLVLADDGKKMSKRLQNYPDPMSIVNKYGSDCLRLYLLSSSATRGESLRFSEAGVHNIMKDIIIPLNNTIKFWKEYYLLYSKKINDKLIININDNIDSINNPINIWILSEYSKLRNEYYTSMNEYNLKNAVSTLFKLVEIINNGYIKLARSLIKGKNTDEEWLESLSTLYYIIRYIIFDYRAVLPFYCENQYLLLKELVNFENDNYFDFASIHLSNYYTFDSFVLLSEEKKYLATDFNIIYVIMK